MDISTKQYEMLEGYSWNEEFLEKINELARKGYKIDHVAPVQHEKICVIMVKDSIGQEV